MRFLLLDNELVPFPQIISFSLFADKKDIKEAKEILGIKLTNGITYTYIVYAHRLSETEREIVLKSLGKFLSRNRSITTIEEILSTVQEAITELRNPKPQRRGRRK